MNLSNSMQRFINSFHRTAIVLMYHRIADVSLDPWSLAVSPTNFEQHVQILMKKYHVVSLPELNKQLSTRSFHKKTVAITFDDGYRDNYLVAKPILEKYSCPAAFFISSYFINKKNPFWWDELTTIILETPKLPQQLTLEIDGTSFLFGFQNDHVISKYKQELQKKWKTRMPPPTERCTLYLNLWQLMRPLSFPKLTLVMNQLRKWIGDDTRIHCEGSLPMSYIELETLADNPKFLFGMHTMTHTALGFQPADVQEEEIVENKVQLQHIFRRDITSIAYPYGSYNNDTIEIVKNQKLALGFTTKGKALNNKTHCYEIGRFQIKDNNGTDFQKLLKKWAHQL